MACFPEIWLVDFEFCQPPGERVTEVHCLVAYEVHSGRIVRLWKDDFGPEPPYSIGDESLIVAYYASAELSCHLHLGWKLPTRVLDLCAEFKAHTSGLQTPTGSKGLTDAMAWFRLDCPDLLVWKKRMRALGARGGPYTAEEQAALLNYCEADVAALERLLAAMLPSIDMPHALWRGRYMRAEAWKEWHGVPINAHKLDRMRRHWAKIRPRLTREMDHLHVYRDDGSLDQKAFLAAMDREGIPWPRTPVGRPDLRLKTFEEMAEKHPQVTPLKDLKVMLDVIKLADLAVGHDGRNRTLLGAFGSKTGRDQPSNAKFIFGPSTCLRGLIEPPPGHGLAYIDWSAQEFAIAAALSGDENMMRAYRTGDPHLAFGIEGGLLPPDATKETHGPERDRLKTCVLGVQFGMRERTLAERIHRPAVVARKMIHSHYDAFPKFWRYVDGAVDTIMQTGILKSVLGWPVHLDEASDVRPNSFLNFPMQSNGAEMMRLASCLVTEADIELCATIHDALLICAPLDRLDEDIARTKAFMMQASRMLLKGFEVRAETKDGLGVKFPTVIRYPRHYMDPRGKDMWDKIWRLIEDIEAEENIERRAAS